MSAKRYKESLLQETREEPGKADAKASILLAASGIGAAALLTVGTTATWYPGHLRHSPAPVFAWLAVGLALAGILFLGLAVKPRLNPSPRKGQPPHYFGDVDEYYPKWWRRKSRDELLQRGREQYATRRSRQRGKANTRSVSKSRSGFAV